MPHRGQVTAPKILLLDIETAPATAYVWKLFDENVGLDQLITPGRIICWAAKWYKGKMHFADERGNRNAMLKALHALMSPRSTVNSWPQACRPCSRRPASTCTGRRSSWATSPESCSSCRAI
jgi:hypothetical protein